jgi:sensor domain DACNV-containing protein
MPTIETQSVLNHTIDGPAYPAARTAAATIEEYFKRRTDEVRQRSTKVLAPQPDAAAIETIIEKAFWASLRKEEGFSPKISLAFLPPELAGEPLRFERPLDLTPHALSRLAPAVERPGIHLGVWRTSGSNELQVWGTTRAIPKMCFVLEVIEPGLLVIKYRRGQDTGKYVNVAVLKGDQIKLVDERGANLPDCPDLLTALLDFGSRGSSSDSINVLVQLAVSMRAHGRGGLLLVVPHTSDTWRESILHPVLYAASPPYTELSELMRKDPAARNETVWQEEFIDAVESVAGLTAVDGAAVINDQYDLFAFGAKIVRRISGVQVERVIVTEPIIGGEAVVMPALELGGTRHLSAAQFVHDQQGALALVASQDGRFTVLAWSPCEQAVHAHRVDSLLL